MNKIILAVVCAVAILGFGGMAMASMLIPASDQAKEHSQAPEHSPVISQTAAGEWDLERVDFIHYVKPENPARPPKSDSCYKLLGVKWRSLPVSYVINPTNPQGLTDAFVTGTIATAAEVWDAQTSAELIADTFGVDSQASYGVQDFENAIVFGNYPDPNVIGVTSIWYTRVGKQIVEFDMLLDTDFSWGDGEGNPALMDLENIATHEFGHAVGLDDLYATTCTEVTMYGYSQEGEIKKRTLEPPDILGLQKMYGL